MDLKKAEKTLNELEESSIKVKQVGKAIDKLKEIQDELESLPEKIEEKNTQLNTRITELERGLTKKHEKLFKDIENLNNISKDLLTKNLEAFENFKKQSADERAFLKKELRSVEKNINIQQTALEKSLKKVQSESWTIKFTLFAVTGIVILIALNNFS